jgi:hypothetical protein
MGSLSVALKNKVDCAGIQGAVQSGVVCYCVMCGFFSDDPVDAVNDAELLAMVLGHRADQIMATAWAALDTRDVIKRAQNNGG